MLSEQARGARREFGRNESAREHRPRAGIGKAAGRDRAEVPRAAEVAALATIRRRGILAKKMLRYFLFPLLGFSLFAQGRSQGQGSASAAPGGPVAGAAAAAGAVAAAGPGAGGIDQDRLLKAVDDLMWHIDLGDIADVDKVEYTSLPPVHIGTARPGAGNPLIIRAYTFIPKKLDRSKPQPLIVFAHQGIHANSDTRDAHVFRELLEQGYSIFSPDYRGSTGYGRGFYEQIDYGGREVDDVYLGTLWMLENYSFLDPKRVGMIGWSHGGGITLMNIFEHPQYLRGGLCGRAGQRPGDAHGLREPATTSSSTRRPTTSAGRFARTWPSIRSARRSRTPGSCRRRC